MRGDLCVFTPRKLCRIPRIDSCAARVSRPCGARKQGRGPGHTRKRTHARTRARARARTSTRIHTRALHRLRADGPARRGDSDGGSDARGSPRARREPRPVLLGEEERVAPAERRRRGHVEGADGRAGSSVRQARRMAETSVAAGRSAGLAVGGGGWRGSFDSAGRKRRRRGPGGACRAAVCGDADSVIPLLKSGVF